MFTGIIEELGRAAALKFHAAGARLDISCETVLSDLTTGASIAVNGVCLTAIEIRADGFSADLAPETLQRSNLGNLTVGTPVNLERPLTMQTRLSGHFVQGHVDGVGTVLKIADVGDGNREISLEIPEDLDRYLVYKGSVTLDGISLTIASIAKKIIRIAVIPHTWHATNIQVRRTGDKVNIECDVLAKHVEKLLSYAAIDSTKAFTKDEILSAVKSEG